MTRLYPDGAEDFFEAAPVRHSLVNVLFVWCRMHPDTSYRQGMHELVAPLYFVLEGEKLRPSSVPGRCMWRSHVLCAGHKLKGLGPEALRC